MKNSFEESLLSSGKLMKRGFSTVAENAGKTIALIAAVVAVLVTFTEIGFYGFDTKTLTANVLLILIASYIIYFSLESAGEKLGRECKEYKSALGEYEEICGRIKGDMLSSLREFVAEYRRQELEFRQRNALIAYGKTPDEYGKYLEGQRVSRKDRRVFRRVSKMREIKLSAATLLSARASGEREEIRNPEGRKRMLLVLKLIPSTLCTVFTVSVMLGAREDLNAIGVIESLLHLSCLPIVGLKGYSAGYEYATGDQVGWLMTKTRLLGSFLKERPV